MKKIIVVAVLAMLALTSANAQMPKYKDIKGLYNPKEYVPQDIDPYNPGLSGLLSFFVPGSAQILNGSVGRGFIFLGADMIAYNIIENAAEEFSGLAITDSEGKITGYTDEAAAKKQLGIMVGGLAGMLAVAIWSSCDATRVAKVKNMYYQDLYGKRAAVDFGLEPFFSFTPTAATPSGSSLTPAAGMTLRFCF